MNQPVRPIHIVMTLLIFIYNLITTIGAFVKEVVYLFDTHLHYEYELNDRIDELHEDLERLQEE
jgi:hypothetical protein